MTREYFLIHIGLSLGDLSVEVPPGRLVYQTDIDLSATRGFVLRVSAGLDLDSRTATWLVQAIDPETGELLEGDGAEGLLRPGEGGSVRYTVQADEDAASGREVSAEARVILDVSAPEDTDPFVYLLDQGAPVTTFDARLLPGTNDYRITWSAAEEAGGSGVRDANIYVSLDDGDFRIVESNETTGEFIYTAPEGAQVDVLVLARDPAGNRDAAPPGIAAGGDLGREKVDLGGTDVDGTTEEAPLPIADPALPDPANPLFIQALEGVPATISPLRPGVYAAAIAPFAFEAFISDLPGSQGGIGALAVLGLEDGSVLYSGGPDRAWLYRVDAEGAGGEEPLARLGTPIYDLAQAPDGRLWATSGGGALLELDLDTGQVLGTYGDGVTQSVTVAPDGTIYVSTGDGVAVFDPETGGFGAFSDTRVDDLAIAPDGVLWGTSWPDRGRVLRFGADGEAEVVVEVPGQLDSITFGRDGTEFAGLALLSSAQDHGGGASALSRIYALDVASHQMVSVAAAPIRGEGITALSDGRVMVAHGSGLDVLRPLFAPQVIASTLENGAITSQPVASFSFRFDDDMATSGAGSVLDLANFALINGLGDILPITAVDYDEVNREVTLRFASLPRGIYAISLSADLRSARGVALGAPHTVEFTRLQDVTANVDIAYQNTRFDRQTDTATYEVIVTNTGARPLLAPLRLTLDTADPTGSGTPLDGVRSSNIWLIDLTEAIGEDGVLRPGESASARAITLLIGPEQRAAFAHGVRILPGGNTAPIILEDMLSIAEVGVAYEHGFTATDLEGDSIGYVLVSGPEGMELDAETGVLTWTPDDNALAVTPVVVRAYDDAGGFGEVTWNITIEEGLNTAPELESPVSVIELFEGEEMRLPILAFDPDFDRLLLFADKLPPGAFLDQDRQELVWTPQPGQRGLYQGVTIGASDGAAHSTASFDILVRPGNAAPVVATPLPVQGREGDPLRIALAAADPEGGVLSYSAPVLPAGAVIDPDTGVLEWTPSYTQKGSYQVPVDVSDGTGTTRIVLRIDIANANGAPVMQGFDDWTITEGQAIFFRTAVLDPDNPDYILPERAADGSLLDYEGSQRRTVTYEMTGLPDGASYDADTGQFLWQTDFADAGRYVMRLTATDDGDGTGLAAVRSYDITINVEDLNRPPELPELPNRSVAGGEVLEIPLSSVDPDGNLLRFSATATRAAGADQISLDPTPIPLDGSSPFGELVTGAGGAVTLRLTPQELDRGDWRIDLRVEDDGNGSAANAQSDDGSFVLTVEAANLGPRLSPVAGLVAVPGEELAFEFEAVDADRDPLTFGIAGLPVGAVITPGASYGRAVLRWTPTAGEIGDHTLTLTVTDSGAGVPADALSDTLVIPVAVRADNGAPILQPVGDITVAELEPLALQLSAADPDGDPLTYSATGLPPGASIDPLTGILSFTPHTFQSGTYEDITLIVTDGKAVITETVTMTVTNTNRAPIFVQTPPQTGREGAEFGFRLLAGDIDGDGLIYEPVGALPAGATLDPVTGEFRWTPDFDQAGTYTIKVRARDAAGAATEQDVAVNVLNRNREPELTLRNHAVVLGETLTFTVGATDPDTDDTLVLSAENLPDTASFDPATGVLTFRPEVGDLGDNVIRFSAFDGTDTVSRNIVLRVTRAPQLPVAVLEVTPRFPARAGQTVTLSVAGTGFVPVELFRLTIDGQEVALDDLNRASFVAQEPGRVTAVLEVTDADGRVGIATRVIAIRDATDRAAPELALNIADGAVLAAGDVTGSVTDPSLESWRLLLVPGNGGPAIVLGAGTGEVTNGALGRLDPGLVQSGFHTLRIEAVDVAGLSSSLEQQVEVLPASSATLRRTEVDATVDLGGVSLDLTRTYDARDAGRSGEFGPGWQAGWADLRLDAGPGAQFNRALQEGDRVHLTAPDGTRLVFSAVFETRRIAGLDQAILRFTSDQTGYTLSHSGPLLTESEGGLYSVVTGLPYSPFGRGGEVLTLTTPDGTIWHADGNGSVSAIEIGGTRLIVADSGIIAPDGSAVQIVTNPLGGIAGLLLPDGARRIYLYDDAGRLSFAGGAGVGTPMLYAYEAGAAGRLIAATGTGGAQYSYAADGSVSTTAASHHFGTLAEAAPRSIALAAGAVDGSTLAVRASELASANGRIILRVEIDGPAPAALRLSGIDPLTTERVGTATVALFAVETSGLHSLQLTGGDAGTYRIAITAAGDLDGDGAVNGTDLGAQDASPTDINGDGKADAADRALLLQNFGLLPNAAPVLTPQAQKTYSDLAIEIPLVEMASDAEGDPIFFEIVGAVGGTAVLTPDGCAIRFTPEAGRTDPGRVFVRASDGYRASGAQTLTIDISGAALERIDFSTRAPYLADGQRLDFDITGHFADGGTAALPEGYVTVDFADSTIARLRAGHLEALNDGFSLLTATRGAVTAATVVRVGALDSYDQSLITYGAEVYPEAVVITPGSARQLLLFDPFEENVIETRLDEVQKFVVNGNIVEVTADGRIIGKAVGETIVQVIYRATELLVPVQVRAPVVGDAVPVGKAGGIVQNADGYQVAIAEDSLPREVEVTIETLDQSDLDVAPLPQGIGIEFNRAFRLDTGDAPMRLGAQLAIPTDLPAGTKVSFYRISDFVTPDGLVKGYQEVETGLVGADGFARTTSPPFDGLKAEGEYVMAKIDESLTREVGFTTDIQAKSATDAVQSSAFITGQGGVGGAFIGALNAGRNAVLNLPRNVSQLVTTVFNADNLAFVRDTVVELVEGIGEFVVSVIGSAAAEAIAGTEPLVTSTNTLLVGTSNDSAIVDPRLEIRGNRLAAPIGSTKPLPSWVVFGDFDRDELQTKMLAAEDADVDTVLRAKFTNGVAVRADHRVENGEDVLTVRPPRDVAVESVVVVRPDTAYQTYGFAPTPSRFASGTATSGGYRDVTWEFSTVVPVRGRETDTFVTVEQGIKQPEGADVTQTRGDIDQVVVIREEEFDPPLGSGSNMRPALVARIPIGYLDADGETITEMGSVRPDKAVLNQSATRMYVGLTGVGGIAVVDTVMYRQIDVKPEDESRINFIEIPGASIGEVFLDRYNDFLIATDTREPMLYFIGINPDDPSSYHQVHHTKTLDLEWPITAATLTPDFKQVIVTQSQRGIGNGRAAVFDLAELMDVRSRPEPLFEFGLQGEGNGTFLRNPTGVQTRIAIESNEVKAIVLDGGRQLETGRSTGAYNGTVVVLNRSNADDGRWVWEVEANVSFNFPLEEDFDTGNDPFAVADPTDVVFSADGKTAFVMGQRRFDERMIERNPNLGENSSVQRYRNNLAGTNIAIIENLLGTSRGETPRVVAATRGIPLSWGTDLGVSSDGDYIFMSGGRLGSVLAYGIDEIKELLKEAEDDTPFYDHPIDDLRTEDGDTLTKPGNERTLFNRDIDIRAGYGRFRDGNIDRIGPAEGLFAAYAPILTGGTARSVAESRSIINLVPEGVSGDLNVTGGTGSITLPGYTARTNPQPTFHFELTDLDEVIEVVFTLAAAAPREGLYVGDSTEPEIAALRNIGYVDSNLAGDALANTLQVEGNRNRIFTLRIPRDQIVNNGESDLYKINSDTGRFEVTLPGSTVMTAGQQYYWGVETVLQGSNNHPRTARLEASLVIDPAKPANGQRYAGVTVVTHGLSAPLLGPEVGETSMFALAKAVARQTGGVILLYDPGLSSSDDAQTRFGNWVAINGDPRTANSIVLVPDWIDATTVNDTGFAEAAGDAFFAEIIDLDRNELTGLLGSPLHFIGQDRGAAVNSEIVQRLLTTERAEPLGAIHVTTIDPGSVQKHMKIPLADFLGAVEDMSKLVAVGFFTYGLVQTYGTIMSFGTVAPVTVPATAAAFRYAKAAADFSEKVGDAKKVVTRLGFDTIDFTNFQDPKVVNWKGVGFADNYYQQAVKDDRAISFSWRGMALDSADVNMNLTGLPGFFEDDAVPDFSLGLGVGTVNARAVGWYLGTVDLGADTYTGVGESPDNIWRQASDRFIETKTAFPPPDDALWEFGKLARYYNDASEPTPANIADSAEGFDKNLKSWYGARELENRRARTDAHAALDNTAWEGVGTGWFYSSMGGGSGLQRLINNTDRTKFDPAKVQNATQPGQSEVIEDIFNGDFESTFRPFYGRAPVPLRSAYEIAGWSFLGGGIGNDKNINPQVGNFDAATLLQSIPFPGLNSLKPKLTEKKLLALLPRDANGNITVTETALNQLKTFLNFLINETMAFKESQEIIGAFEKSKITELPGLMANFVQTTGTKLFDLGFGGGTTDLIREMWLMALQRQQDAFDSTVPSARAAFGVPSTDPGNRAILDGWLTNEDGVRREASIRSATAGFVRDELVKRIPLFLKFIQEHLLTYSFELQPGRSLVHNTMKFSEDQELIGVDLTWHLNIFSSIPDQESGARLRVYAEVDDILYELQPDSAAAAITGEGDLLRSSRIMYQIPAQLRGDVGRLVIFNDTETGYTNNPYAAEIDNISFDGKVEMFETDGDPDDLNILFKDAGQSFENSEGVGAFLRAEETGTGIDRHEMTFVNNNDKAVRLTLTIPQNDFLVLGGVQGIWRNGDDGSLLSDTPLDMRAGDSAATVTLFLPAGEMAILSMSASVDRDRLQELLGAQGVAILTAQMQIDYTVDNTSQSYSNKANLFYLLDAGDSAANDGTIQLADTTTGQEREIVIPVRGVLGTFDGIKGFVGQTQRADWFDVRDSTPGQITLSFAPTGVAAVPGQQPVIDDNGVLRLFWQDLELGTYAVEGRGTAKQVINLDAERLREALRAQLETLVEREAAQEMPEEESFAALFANLTEDSWEDVITEIETRVGALLAPAGENGFRIVRGADGDLTFEFTGGSDAGATLPIEITEEEEAAETVNRELDEAINEISEEVNSARSPFEEATDLLNGIFVGEESELEALGELAADFASAGGSAVASAREAQEEFAAEAEKFKQVVDAIGGDTQALDSIAAPLQDLHSEIGSARDAMEQISQSFFADKDALITKAETIAGTPEQIQTLNLFKTQRDTMFTQMQNMLSGFSGLGFGNAATFQPRDGISDAANSGLASLFGMLKEPSGGGLGGIGGRLLGALGPIADSPVAQEVFSSWNTSLTETRGVLSGMLSSLNGFEPMLDNLHSALGGDVTAEVEAVRQSGLFDDEGILKRLDDSVGSFDTDSLSLVAAITRTPEGIKQVSARAFAAADRLEFETGAIENDLLASEAAHIAMQNFARDSENGGEETADALTDAFTSPLAESRQRTGEVTRGSGMLGIGLNSIIDKLGLESSISSSTVDLSDMFEAFSRADGDFGSGITDVLNNLFGTSDRSDRGGLIGRVGPVGTSEALTSMSSLMTGLFGDSDRMLQSMENFFATGNSQMSAAAGDLDGMAALVGRSGELLSPLSTSGLIADPGRGGLISSTSLERIVEALQLQNAPTNSSGGQGGILGSSRRLLDEVLKIFPEAAQGQSSQSNPFAVSTSPLKQLTDKLGSGLDGLGSLIEGMLGGGNNGGGSGGGGNPVLNLIAQPEFTRLLGEIKAATSEGNTWFAEAEAALGEPVQREPSGGSGGGGLLLGGSGARGMLNTLFPNVLDTSTLTLPSLLGASSNNLSGLGALIQQSFEDNSGILSQMQESFQNIKTEGTGVLERMLQGVELAPNERLTLSGKIIDQNAAWGRAEAQLSLNETWLGAARDAADAAGVGAGGALGALDSAIDGTLGDLAPQAALLGTALDGLRDIADRIADLDPTDTAGAAALRDEFIQTADEAAAAAGVTREKVDAAASGTDEPLQNIIDEVAEIGEATRLGFASFDFTPVNPGPDLELDTLLRTDIDDELTVAQQRYRLDALFNADRLEDRVVINTGALFDALRAPSSEEGFDPIAAFAETVAWTYVHEIAHTLGLPDLYDFENGAALEGAGFLGIRNDFTMTEAHKGVVRLASDQPEPGEEADVSQVLDMLRTARTAGVLDRAEADENGDFLLAPPTGSIPLAGTGWRVLGDVTVDGTGELEMVETGINRTTAYRDVTVPPDASEFRFTLRSRLVSQVDAPPDAFEVAFLRSNGTALTQLGSLSNTDAALNLQGPDQLRTADGVSVVDQGTDADGFTVYDVTLDLDLVGDPATLSLSLDLLGFGTTESRVKVGDFRFDIPSTLDNTAPVLTSGSSVELDEDGSALIDLRTLVSDAEGDDLTFEITTQPQNGTMEPVETGVWRYSPAADFNGSDSLRFTASDGAFRPLPVTLNLIVRPLNDAPVLPATDRATVLEGSELVMQIAATDVDGDPLRYRLETGPAGAALTEDGRFSWTAGDSGAIATFGILVEDGQGGSARQKLEVTVENAPPVLALGAPLTTVVETVTDVTIAWRDPGDDAVGNFIIDWGDGTRESVPDGQVQLSHVYNQLGAFTVTLTGEDDEGARASTSQVIEVVTPGLRVTQLTSGPWGVNVRFNEAVDTGLPNPYRLDSRPGEPVDVLLLDTNGDPVRGSLVPDADARGFTFLASDDALPPGEYRLRLTANDLGWRNRWDILEAGPQGYEERVITIAETPVTLQLQDAVQVPGEALGIRGQGLAISMDQSGGLRSMVLRVMWDSSMMNISGLLSALPGATVSRVDDGRTTGEALYRITFETSPEPGLVELGRLMGQMDAAAAYATSGAPLRVRAVEINGVPQGAPEVPDPVPFGIRAFGVAAATAPPAPAAEARGLTLVAQRGDADGDGTASQQDIARFAQIPEDALVGLDAWSFIDPNLLRPLPADPHVPAGRDLPGPQPIGPNAIGSLGSGGETRAGFAGISYGAGIAGQSAFSLVNAAQEGGFDGRDTQQRYLRSSGYDTPVPLCLVPEGSAGDSAALAHAARTGLCFEGLPADLADPDQLWRLNGISKAVPEASGRIERVLDGPVCITGALPDGAEDGDRFFLKPLSKGADASADVSVPNDLPPQYRMCFDQIEPEVQDATEEAEGETAIGAQEDAALRVAPAHASGLNPFTALSLMSAAVVTRAAKDRNRDGRGNTRHTILFSDMTETGRYLE